MGAERGFNRWAAAAGMMAIAIVAWGSSVAKELDARGAAQSKAAVKPGAYRLPAQVAALRPPAQPIAFSHAQHAGTLALACAICHVGAGPNADQDVRSMNGMHMTLPGTQVCMNCHVAIAADRPDIKALARYHAAGEEVPWVRIYRVLKGVNWTHKAHLGAGIKCQTCHGDVARMAVMAIATPVTAMASCLGCHRATQANSSTQAQSQAQGKSSCETCHAWPAAEDFQRWSH